MNFARCHREELFDLEADPHEMQNLYGQPEYAAIASELKVELERLRAHYGDRLEDVGDNPW